MYGLKRKQFPIPVEDSVLSDYPFYEWHPLDTSEYFLDFPSVIREFADQIDISDSLYQSRKKKNLCLTERYDASFYPKLGTIRNLCGLYAPLSLDLVHEVGDIPSLEKLTILVLHEEYSDVELDTYFETLLTHLEKKRSLKHLTIQMCPAYASYKFSSRIKNLQSLESLTLIDVVFDDSLAVALSKIPSLKELRLKKGDLYSEYTHNMQENILPLSLGKCVQIESLVIEGAMEYNPLPYSPDSLFKELRMLKNFTFKQPTSVINHATTIVDTYTQQLLKGSFYAPNLEALLISYHLDSIPLQVGNLSQLRELELTTNYCPSTIGMCENLEQLFLSTAYLPAEFGNLFNLTYAHLQIPSFEGLEDSLKALESLQCLKVQTFSTLDDINLPYIPNLMYLEMEAYNKSYATISGIGRLRELQTCYIYHLNVGDDISNATSLQRVVLDFDEGTSLGPLRFQEANVFYGSHKEEIQVNSKLFELPSLKFLFLRGNPLTVLNDDIPINYSLDTLAIMKTGISDLPPSLSSLKNIRFLNLQQNQFEYIPLCLSKLQKLTYLWMDNNDINKIDQSIKDLQKLEYLSLSNNNLTKLPTAINKLQSLRFLDCQGNKIKKCRLLRNISTPKLEVLNLGNNELVSINFVDKPILKHLVFVDLGNNNIRRLSPRFFQIMPNLRALDLQNNLLIKVPAEIGNLSLVSWIDFMGNGRKDGRGWSMNLSTIDNGNIQRQVYISEELRKLIIQLPQEIVRLERCQECQKLYKVLHLETLER